MNKNYVIGLTCREADRDPLSTSLALDDGLLGVLSSKDYACVILPNLDYETQLIAIRHLLVTHEKMVKAMDEKTEEFQRVIKKYKGSRYEFAVDELSEKIGFFHLSKRCSKHVCRRYVGTILRIYLSSSFLWDLPRILFGDRKTKTRKTFPLGEICSR